MSIGVTMSSAIQDRPVRQPTAEETALQRLVDRLVQQFPELPPEEIVRAVHGRYAEHEHSRVRDFVPVLVERAARRELSAQPAPRYRA
jgi:hypothetical protein